MKKRLRKKLANGGLMGTALHDPNATTGQEIGQFAQLQAVQNQVQDTAFNMGNDYLAKQGFDQGELDIIKQDSGQNLSKIPGIGMGASMIKGGFNLLTGRTGDRLKNYRADKIISNSQQTSDFNDLSGYAQDAQVTFAMGGDLSIEDDIIDAPELNGFFRKIKK